MKLVIIEPLGVEKETLLEIADKAVGKDAEIVYYDTRVTDDATLIERGKDADIIVVANLPLNETVIDGCKNLKLLAVAFTGIDHIAVEACRKRNITICNCAGYSNAAVSDLVFGLLINLYRNIIPCNEVVRKSGTKPCRCDRAGIWLRGVCVLENQKRSAGRYLDGVRRTVGDLRYHFAACAVKWEDQGNDRGSGARKDETGRSADQYGAWTGRGQRGTCESLK